ncbi:MAG: FAD-dependent oxidoreductase [Gemmataceae bacterium]
MILPRVAIIGGGPGGLMTAHLLERRSPTPLDITLLEASPRLGGKVVTGAFRSHPVPYEIGAAELYDYSQLGQDPLRELIDELGLPTRPMRGGTVVFRDHILKNLDDVSRVLGAPTAKALRAFNRRARSLISRAEYYESDWKADNNDPTSRQSFHDFLKSVPDEEARRFIQIAVHSDLATEPHLTNAMYGLQNSLMDEEDYMRLYTIDGGLERLPRAIAERISARVLLHSPVVKVERLPNEAYRVFFKRAGELVQEDFDFVVVALPNN